MKVLFAGHTGQPMGGIATYCESILSSTLREKVELLFVETSAGELGYDQRGKLGWRNFSNTGKNIYHFFRQMLKFRPELVHVVTSLKASFYKHGLMVFIARLLGARVILHPHFSVTRLYSSNRLHNLLVRSVLGSCQGLVVLSKEWLRLNLKMPMALIPNGIELAPYLEIERKTTTEGLHILYLGHLREDKGLFDLLTALAQIRQTLPRVELRCVGEAKQAGEVARLKTELEILHLQENVSIHPPVFGAEKCALFAWADIFVLPSHHEGLPVSIIEAMACGLPVVASAVGGIPDLVDDGQTGLLVEAHQPLELADALVRLLTNPELQIKMGAAGREKALACHAIESHVQKLYAFYCSSAPEQA
jgi:glycosyltransferase involved in cell wall biosynthesis